jgi:hypothetical protein
MLSEPLKVGFDTDLTIRNAAVVKAMLSERLLVARSVSLELNPEAAVDLSFVQLMSAARIRQRNVGGDLALTAPAGPKLRDVLQRAGFIEGASAEDLKFWLHSENAQ